MFYPELIESKASFSNQTGATMTLHNSRQSFVFEIISGDVFIRVGRWTLSWYPHT
jgi:hypothetical protein